MLNANQASRVEGFRAADSMDWRSWPSSNSAVCQPGRWTASRSTLWDMPCNGKEKRRQHASAGPTYRAST
eukprot:4534492-Pyramimonas_sp.AAC.1